MSTPSNKVVRVLLDTDEYTKRLKHDKVTIDHLGINILKASKIKELFEEINVNIDGVIDQIESIIIDNTPQLSYVSRVTRNINIAIVLAEAAKYADIELRDNYDIGDVLVAIYNSSEKTLLNQFLKQVFKSEQLIKDFVKKSFVRETENANGVDDDIEDTVSPLKKYCVNLNEKAKNGDIDKVISREDEILRISEILFKRKKNNPILIGDPGVGKTAIIEGLAIDIVNGSNKILSNIEIHALDVTLMVAGTKYRGEFEQRIKGLIEEIKNINAKGEKRIILFIDEIHMIIGAGAGSALSMDVSNILKPAMARGELSIIGSTTFSEYRENIEKDKALNRRFDKVNVNEPNQETAIKIVKQSIDYYQKHHAVEYPDKIISRIVSVAKFHFHDKFLPDSAFDLADNIGSKMHLKHGTTSENIYKVTDEDIDTVVADILNIPVKTVSKDKLKLMLSVEENVKKKIFGQDASIDKLMRIIKRNKAGLGNPEKPIANVLFSGPSGVGKTETAKIIAAELGINFLRIDMSEYADYHAVSKLIGTQAGFVGYGDDAILSDEIRKHPHTVLLLDEIEKAHQRVIQLFLQVFDYGKLTDGKGNVVDFRNVIIIMTSNLGTKGLDQLGFTKVDDFKTEREIKKFFAPEIINRLDAMITFKELSPEVLEKVLDKEIKILQDRIKTTTQLDVILKFTDNLRKEIIAKGYKPEYGARELQRTIQEIVGDELSSRILNLTLKQGSYKIDFIDEKITITKTKD